MASVKNNKQKRKYMKSTQIKPADGKAWKKYLAIAVVVVILLLGGLTVYLTGIGLGPAPQRVTIPDADHYIANGLEIYSADGKYYQSHTGGSLSRGSKIRIEIPGTGLRVGTQADVYLREGRKGMLLGSVAVGSQKEKTLTTEVTIPRSIPITLIATDTIEVFVHTDSSELLNYYRSVHLK